MSRKKKQRDPPPKFATAGTWHTRFIPFFEDMLKSPAYIALTASAKEVYTIIRMQYKGESYSYGGVVKCPYSTLNEYGLRNGTISTCIDQLEIFGFIEVERGGLEHRPSEYKLSEKWKTLSEPELLSDAKVKYSELKRRKKLASENSKRLREEYQLTHTG